MVAQDVCSYLRQAERAALMRPVGLSELDRAEVARQVVAFGHRPFNRRFQWEPDDGSVYCTQYVWLILARAWPSGVRANHGGEVLGVPALLDGLPLEPVTVLGGQVVEAGFKAPWSPNFLHFDSLLHASLQRGSLIVGR